MGDILELLFSNIVILAAVIGGIISFVSGLNKKEKEKSKQPKQPSSPLSTSSQQPSTNQEPEQMKESASTSDGRMKEYYEEKQKRLDEIREYQKKRGQRSTPSSQTNEELDQHADDEQAGSVNKKSAFSHSNQWDKKRLADGIIMSEVLGPPRAHRPHRSHPRKR
ncbi:hypothetical protein [Halobacillus amylolyticus]|uniref:Uncharacterized protein n=1 Tax=Halobacillus amylolyticus TaxID=2932259 RepID=A0ABY4HC69_9BACI|nr:hypothetical protein [Halobacillus amylolyticus]UOR12272.1 hypothetical protein MUO15_01670 [Halobacillus amylolyticus]